MIKSIKLKLWLTIFVTLIVSSGALLATSYISVKLRFMDYATDQILERLEPLEQAILEEYKKNKSLDSFRTSPSLWIQVRDATYRQYLRDQTRRKPDKLEPNQQDWSEKESLERKLQPDQRAFFQHLVLFDKNKALISGRKKEDGNYIYRDLRFEGNQIAYIGYVKPKGLLRTVDKLFVDQQIQSLSYLSLIMVFTALLVTLFVSGWITKPLSALARSAKKVASGDFSVRVGFSGDDELGKLCQDFDEMAQSLEKNEKVRKQWVADISHEMRTPLSVLKAQLEAMEDGIRPSTTENIQLLKRNVDSLSFIIDELYELSLADIGALKLNKENIDLNSLMDEMGKEFEEKFRTKNIILENQKNNQQLTIRADKKRLQQVFTNLLENSFRYTKDGGKVLIKLEESDSNIAITVEDSEPGVPTNMLEKIYDRLFRMEESRNRETGGAGLGLSICKGIAEAHNGKIIASQSSLGGLKQTLSFPKEQQS